MKKDARLRYRAFQSYCERCRFTSALANRASTCRTRPSALLGDRASGGTQRDGRACVACYARLSVYDGRLRPIFHRDLAEFRAEFVCATLRAALRRRPGAAPLARALCPLWNYFLTGPWLPHLLPRTLQPTSPQASRLVLCHRIWRPPGPQEHHRTIPSELKARKVPPPTSIRVCRTCPAARQGDGQARFKRRNHGWTQPASNP